MEHFSKNQKRTLQLVIRVPQFERSCHRQSGNKQRGTHTHTQMTHTHTHTHTINNTHTHTKLMTHTHTVTCCAFEAYSELYTNRAYYTSKGFFQQQTFLLILSEEVSQGEMCIVITIKYAEYMYDKSKMKRLCKHTVHQNVSIDAFCQKIQNIVSA